MSSPRSREGRQRVSAFKTRSVFRVYMSNTSTGVSCSASAEIRAPRSSVLPRKRNSDLTLPGENIEGASPVCWV